MTAVEPYRRAQIDLPGVAAVTPTGLEFAEDATEDEWRTVGEVLGRIEAGSRWWRGDWANHGGKRYGRTYDELEDATGMSQSTLKNDAYVAKRFEKSRRRDFLPFAHHEELASLDPGEQDKWLDTAEANDWSRKELRDARKAYGKVDLDGDDTSVTVQSIAKQFEAEGLDDAQRLDRLGISIQPYDVWHFPSCHSLMGDAHPGRIPGGLLAHVLYFYTQAGDSVVDPMAGSGTTLDACLLMGRLAKGYDIDHRHERSDITAHDLAAGWPASVAEADLVFWDPPYFSKMDSSTIGQDGYIDGSISKLTPDEYLAFFEARYTELRTAVRPGTRFAFLMSDWDPEGSVHDRGIYIWDYVDLLRGAGWTMERHIQVPLSTQQVHPDIVNKFRTSRRLARLERYLLIAKA